MHDERLSEQGLCICFDCAPAVKISLERAIEDLENRVMRARPFEELLFEMRTAREDLAREPNA